MTSNAFERRALALLSEALDQPSDTRKTWVTAQCGDDTALATRVINLLGVDAADPEILRTGGVGADMAPPPRPDRIGAYKILDMIGQGGMGAVYIGERDADDFDHTAAIKVIRPGVLSEDLVDRFQRERQILAQLNHPNIARLYDGGETADGMPYIIMEWVDGDPITEWVQRTDLSLDARLDLFCDLCRAVGFAHQNLVIHRDITPSNVLVTQDGIVKLIDFGIAKPQDPPRAIAIDAEAEVEPSLSYTPGYAAPEREEGGVATTLSDLFSLGKLLDAMTEGLSRSTDLIAIIAKATARDATGRYSSADALRDDIVCLRTGHPVDARAGGMSYRFTRYLQRHWLGVSLATTAVALLVVGLITTTSLYQRAEAERLAADQRFNDVRTLAHFMMFDLYDELEKVPGNTGSIALLAEEAQSYLDSLSQDRRASLEVALEAIGGYRRLADILGNPKNANLGLRADSEAMVARALAELRALHTRFPDNPDVMRTLAEAAFSSSTQQYVSLNNNELAIEHAELSADMYRRLIALQGPNFDDRRQLLRARLMTAVPLPWIGRHIEGIETLKAIRDDTAVLVADHPDRPEGPLLLGSLNVEIARGIVRLPEGSEYPDDLIQYWDEAIRLREQSYADNPEDLRPYRSLATIYYERGATHRHRGNYDAAYADALRTEEISRELLAIDPDDDWLKIRLHGVLEEKAKTLSYAGRHDEAREQAQIALDIQRVEFENDPDNPGKLREWGYSQVLLADVFLRAGDSDQGCGLVTDARVTWEALAAISTIAELDEEVSLTHLAELEATCAAQ